MLNIIEHRLKIFKVLLLALFLLAVVDQTRAMADNGPAKTVAVLPFAMHAPSSMAYMQDGLRDMLASARNPQHAARKTGIARATPKAGTGIIIADYDPTSVASSMSAATVSALAPGSRPGSGKLCDTPRGLMYRAPQCAPRQSLSSEPG